MADLITTQTFIQHLTYFIKVGIYINKGTDEDIILDKCITTYNRLKEMELNSEPSPDNDTFIRKCIKRVNLSLKINADGLAINLNDKNNQKNMSLLSPHPSLETGNLTQMHEYATEYNISILSGIPLMFILRTSKYQQQLWNYVQSLFYISQILIANPVSRRGNLLIKQSMTKIENILEEIAKTEDAMKLGEIIAADKFLKMKLVQGEVSDKKIDDAASHIKNLFEKKGMPKDAGVYNVVDIISSKLSGGGLENGSIFDIGQDVIQEVNDHMMQNPEKMGDLLGGIMGVLNDLMTDASNNGEEIPEEIKGIMNCLNVSNTEDVDDCQMAEQLNGILGNENVQKMVGSIENQDLNGLFSEYGNSNLNTFMQNNNLMQNPNFNFTKKTN